MILECTSSSSKLYYDRDCTLIMAKPAGIYAVGPTETMIKTESTELNSSDVLQTITYKTASLAQVNVAAGWIMSMV